MFRTTILSVLAGLWVVTSTASAQVNRTFMDVAGGQGALQPTSGPTIITMGPGETRRIEVWLNANKEANLLAAYQGVWQQQAHAQPGSTGVVTYVDNNPGAGDDDSIFLDTARPDWVFADSVVVAEPTFTEATVMEPLFGLFYSTIVPMDEVDPVSLPQPLYLAEFDITASADACGDHLLVWNTLDNGGPPLPAFFGPI